MSAASHSHECKIGDIRKGRPDSIVGTMPSESLQQLRREAIKLTSQPIPAIDAEGAGDQIKEDRHRAVQIHELVSGIGHAGSLVACER